MRGWSGGAMVLGKLSVPRRPTNLDNSRARAALAVGAGGGCLDIFKFVYLFSFLSPSFTYTFSVSSPQRFLFPLNFTGRSTSLHFVNRPCIDHRGG